MQPSGTITSCIIQGPKLNYQWIYIPKAPVDSILKIETMFCIEKQLTSILHVDFEFTCKDLINFMSKRL